MLDGSADELVGTAVSNCWTFVVIGLRSVETSSNFSQGRKSWLPKGRIDIELKMELLPRVVEQTR
jgi:hypothetical protein